MVETEDKETHVITLEDKLYSRDHLNVFSVDEEYLDHENEYIELKKEILEKLTMKMKSKLLKPPRIMNKK